MEFYFLLAEGDQLIGLPHAKRCLRCTLTASSLRLAG